MRQCFLLLLLAASGCRQPVNQPPSGAIARDVEVRPASAEGRVQVVGGDEAALREFIGRALTYPSPSGASEDLVLIGALPDDLPIDLPLPDGSRVVGSTVRTAEYGGIEVILDIPMAPDAVQVFYQERLLRAGWELAPQPPYSGGFASEPWPSATFCLNQDEAQIYLSVREVPDQPTDVRVNIQSTVQYSACDPQAFGPSDEGSSMIPQLTTPGGTVIESSSGSGGSGTADASATLRTELSPPDLAEHYAEQLRQAGWTQIYQQLAQELGWSTWSITDEQGQPWAGLLLVAERPLHADQVFAWFRVERGE